MWFAWLQEKLFHRSSTRQSGLGGAALRLARIAWFTVREFRADFCAERAATLAFVTLISLIPLAVLFVSLAGQFGYGDEFITYAKKELFPLLAPDFQEKLELWLDKHISKDAFVQALGGWVGLIAFVSLLISAIAVLSTAERNFNRVWKAERSRTYLGRFMVFWVILTTSPFILVASTPVSDFWGIVRSLAEKSIILSAIYTFVVPVLIGCLGFTLLYYLLPAARVRIGSALAGGIVAAVLWELAKRTFYIYVARSLSLYQGLAVVPLFLIWIYVNWFIALLGCEIAYVHQNLTVLTELLERPGLARRLPPALVAVELLRRIGHSFIRGTKRPRLLHVARDIGVNPQEVETAARRLAGAGVIVEHLDEPGVFSLARTPEGVHLDEIVSLFFEEEIPPDLAASLHEREGHAPDPGMIAFRDARSAYVSVFKGKTLREILAPAPGEPTASPPRTFD